MTDREKVIKGLECCNMPNNHDDCPYNGAAHYNTCTHQLLTDAIALLKGQEPRIMTLEEVRAAEVVWLEQVGACVCAIKVQNYDSGTMSFAYAYNNYTSFVNIKQKYYGKISRCWTLRPTDEQRKAAKWDG